MPLLHVVGLTSVYTSFSACFVFLRNEDFKSYKWAQGRVAKLYHPIERHDASHATHSITIATDCDDGILAAIDSVFPRLKNLIRR